MTQTIDLTTANEPELRTWMAELPCTACLEASPAGNRCGGLAFPWASEECPDCNGKKRIPAHAYIGGATGKVDCRTCNGFGRVPKAVGLATVLNELRKMGAYFEIGQGYFNLTVYGEIVEKHRWHWETEEDLLLAALRAIAVQAQGGMP